MSSKTLMKKKYTYAIGYFRGYKRGMSSILSSFKDFIKSKNNVMSSEDIVRGIMDKINFLDGTTVLKCKCRNCEKLIPYPYDFCAECCDKLLNPITPFIPKENKDAST